MDGMEEDNIKKYKLKFSFKIDSQTPSLEESNVRKIDNNYYQNGKDSEGRRLSKSKIPHKGKQEKDLRPMTQTKFTKRKSLA
jgi:hypothetical protein